MQDEQQIAENHCLIVLCTNQPCMICAPCFFVGWIPFDEACYCLCHPIVNMLHIPTFRCQKMSVSKMAKLGGGYRLPTYLVISRSATARLERDSSSMTSFILISAALHPHHDHFFIIIHHLRLNPCTFPVFSCGTNTSLMSTSTPLSIW